MWVYLLCCLAAAAAVSSAGRVEPEPFIDPASRQLYDFKNNETHGPVGVLTTPYGNRVDVRKTNGLSGQLMDNEYFVTQFIGVDSERIPERVVHARGAGAYGYYEVITDMSKYARIDMFRGVGKKTPAICRFSEVVQGVGGSDLERETRGMAVKYYTKEGNLDLVGLHIPIYFYRDPVDFLTFAHAFKRNPRTFLEDTNTKYDFATLRADAFQGLMWLMSDYGIPRGYRKMDGFMQHTFEVYNEHGEKFYTRINYRSEQGLANFTSAEAAEVKSRDKDWFIRDLYNAIAMKNYPSWIVEWYILAEEDLKKVNFDPFDMTKIWPEGTYKTVISGRLTLNRNVDNYFEQVEQVAFSPANLVTGITGAPDSIFRARRVAYIDSARNRIGINTNKVSVNLPFYAMPNNRDGVPYVGNNQKDIPNYYPNSFNGPQTFVDEPRPDAILRIRHTNAIDLLPTHQFYRRILKSEGERQRLIDNIASSLVTVYPVLRERVFQLLELIDQEWGHRTRVAFELAKARAIETAAREAAWEAADEIAAAQRRRELQEELAMQQGHHHQHHD